MEISCIPIVSDVISECFYILCSPSARRPISRFNGLLRLGGVGAFCYCLSAQHKENGTEGNKAKQSERYLVYGAGCFTHAPNYFHFYFKHAM